MIMKRKMSVKKQSVVGTADDPDAGSFRIAHYPDGDLDEEDNK